MFQIHLEEMRPKVLAWDMDKHMAWRGFSNVYKSYIDWISKTCTVTKLIIIT
jgi:hypothetical protein